jgi:excisionase family DNA binding protein
MGIDMHDHTLTPIEDDGSVPEQRSGLRADCRKQALNSALAKQAAGVPSYTVPEAAMLLSVSHEHLYRLIRANVFPAVRMRVGDESGKYVVPADAVRAILDRATAGGVCAEVADLIEQWREEADGVERTGGGSR